ncbi:MAG: serine/threonine protein kinase [Planctomycetaceae bacterium]|nr:serine/threonine protein kinase [Planctomycetaceae bacterium]
MTLQGDPMERDGIDWTFWRGPGSNGISPETGLVDDWDPNGGPGSNVSWKRTDLGSRSTPVTMNGRLYMLCRAERESSREREQVVCLNAATGETIWTNVFNVWLSDVPDTRVGWSNVTADPETGNIYALGVCGLFQCINGETGETIWSMPLHERFGLLSTYGGRTNTPVIVDNQVIISSIVIGWGEMAKPAHRFIAFDKASGEVIWFNGTRPLPYDTTYSTPTVTALAGQRSLVFGSGDGAVWAIQPRTGNHIWQYKFSRRGLNVSPLVVGDKVFSGHSEENVVGTSMGAVVGIDATGTGDVTKSHELWKYEEVMMGKSSPIAIDNRLYCFDDRAKVYVYDLQTGDQIGRKQALGRVMRGSPLYADGKIYAVGNSGNWAIFQTHEDDGLVKLASGRLPNSETMAASPVVSHGRLYFATSGGLYCVEDVEKTSAVAESVLQPEEASSDDMAATHVQVVPADALIRPGQSQEYKVLLYNAAGQLIGPAKDAQLSVDAYGTLEGSTFQSSADVAHVAAYVTATAGELSGRARIRIVPDLPWSFNFDDLTAPPITWVGARYRHVIREVDGSNAMVKITTIPKGTRSRSWMGHSDLSNYTIQADVKGARNNDKMPDIGLTGQGYCLDMQGESQRLQIRTWVPQERMARTLDFAWKEDQWYTMQFRVAVEDGKAVLRAKVWEKGSPEPADWMLEAIDDVPVTQGSPGLYGNAKDAEIYLDNITVTANN